MKRQVPGPALALLQPEFPGEIAGASLKPRLDVDVTGFLVREFPGEIAGASLKPDRVEEIEHRVMEFPGEIAGASLKHAPMNARFRRARVNSPAKSPGPH